MSKIREHVRRTLDAREPTRAEAREDFERILQKIDRPPRSRLFRIAPPLAGLAVAAGVAFVLGLRHPPREEHPLVKGPSPTTPTAAPTAADAAIEIYVRRSDEPESAALSVTLNLRGDRR